jgi:hypothetical protein
VLGEGPLLWQLATRPGIYRPATVLEEVAQKIGHFAAAAGGVDSLGVDLRSPHLAGSGTMSNNGMTT